jgi:hypothetical protein
MKTYRVYLTCTRVYFVDVQAESAKDAEETALYSHEVDLTFSSDNDWNVMSCQEMEA